MTTTNISSTDLRQFSTRLFESIGMPAADADVAAASLVESDLRGIYSHGVVRLQPPYMEEMRDGYTNPTPDIKVVATAPPTPCSTATADRARSSLTAP